MIFENSVKRQSMAKNKEKKEVQNNAITHFPDPRYTTAW